MSDLYTTRTANLRATKGDFNKIFLKNKDILEYINEATPTIKHSEDTRTTVTENDIWGQWIETKSDGTIIVHDDWVTNPNASNYNGWNSSITTVEDNKAYVGDTLYGNIQIEKIKDGTNMFRNCFNLTSFSSDLSSLTNGANMFNNCSQLSEIYFDAIGLLGGLYSLTDGRGMFEYCQNLIAFTYDLPSLMNSNYMFRDCLKLSIFYSDLPNLIDGTWMFRDCKKLESFALDYNGLSINLSNLIIGQGMFRGCTSLIEFTSDLPNLAVGSDMFYGCSRFTSFSSDLHSLMNGQQMFYGCSKLISFSSDLPSLTYGHYMFRNCPLTSFSSDLSSLADGYNMFVYCYGLTSFSSDLSSLADGREMFKDCSKLTSFTSDLSSLTGGRSMFYRCSLDAESVMYIADTIKDITAEKQLYVNGTIPYVTADENYKYSAPKGFMENGNYVYTYKTPQPDTAIISASNVGQLTIGINVSNNAETIQQQLEDFAKEATFDSWDDLKTHFSKRGWTVTFQYGGNTKEIPNEFPNTYDLRNREQIIPCPIFAKLVQVEDKDSAEYCTEDASSFYNIDWGQDVTDTSSYTQFNSLEDAMTSWNVFHKENIISSEQEAQ